MSDYEKREDSLDNRNIDIKYLKEEIEESFYRQYIELLIKSNLELQSKLSELIVVNTNLMKDLKSLLEIFKEAALERNIARKYESEGVSSKKKKEKKKSKEINVEELSSVIERKFDEISKANIKMLEVLNEIENSIKEIRNNEKQNNLNINQNIKPNTFQNINRNINPINVQQNRMVDNYRKSF